MISMMKKEANTFIPCIYLGVCHCFYVHVFDCEIAYSWIGSISKSQKFKHGVSLLYTGLCYANLGLVLFVVNTILYDTIGFCVSGLCLECNFIYVRAQVPEYCIYVMFSETRWCFLRVGGSP